MQVGGRILGLAAVVAGVAGLAFGQFPWTGEPGNAHAPVREILAIGGNGLFVLSGLALGLGLRLAGPAALVLAAMLAVGAGVLQWAGLARHWTSWLVWENLAESVAMIMGALVAWSLVRGGEGRGRVAGPGLRLFGACAVVFGISHFVYLKLTAPLVPAWLPPSRLFWAYATGAAQIAAGLALVSGLARRAAATALTAMYVVFAALVWLPAVHKAAGDPGAWTELGVTLLLIGAAWCAADAAARRRT